MKQVDHSVNISCLNASNNYLTSCRILNAVAYRDTAEIVDVSSVMAEAILFFNFLLLNIYTEVSFRS